MCTCMCVYVCVCVCMCVYVCVYVCVCVCGHNDSEEGILKVNHIYALSLYDISSTLSSEEYIY